ncbi:MAG TPA: hydroxyethylthiazole kinase [Kiritimatiellia bacterium]|nr:hydroxyethylthiazole kinase [Kiritimatiellia bacterium]HMO99501.1 hydroxyethylthiazole kinase [Kiritimatiellia bacterium]HMP97866.1 hydroxyethylthiazole kinase [Kiritimatiellia bacterium]
MNGKSVWADVASIREKNPLVHNITNYVVMNNTANALLALGASPVMAHAADEVEDMVALASTAGGALVVNIGTLSPAWVTAMEAAMTSASAHALPVVLDPVGAGATPYRTETCRRLLAAARPTVIRGNASEIMALLGAGAATKGVDSTQDSDAARESARSLARERGCVISVSGAVDIITDGTEEIEVAAGHPMMTRVTGLGCSASALTGAFLAVNASPLHAAAHAMAVMGICGEIAATRAQGPGSLQVAFIDALYQIDEAALIAHLS